MKEQIPDRHLSPAFGGFGIYFCIIMPPKKPVKPAHTADELGMLILPEIVTGDDSLFAFESTSAPKSASPRNCH